jgi:hypothetical protein
MQPPEADRSMSSFVYEEMAEALIPMLTHVIPRLPDMTRLRLMAFFHLLEHPEAVKADLQVDPAGVARLTLASDSGVNRSTRR